MRSTIRASLRFPDDYSSSRPTLKIVTVSAALFALLLGSHLIPAAQASASFSPATTGASTLQPASITFLTFAAANNANCH